MVMVQTTMQRRGGENGIYTCATTASLVSGACCLRTESPMVYNAMRLIAIEKGIPVSYKAVKSIAALVATLTIAGACMITSAGAVGPPPGAGPVGGLPIQAQAAIAAAQAKVDAVAGRHLALHYVHSSQSDQHGFVTHLYVALPSGETSWQPGDPGPLPYFAQVTGQGSDWQSTVTNPSDLHVFQGPPIPTASTSASKGRVKARLADTLTLSYYSCIGDPQQPQIHWGAYGFRGIWTGTDFIDCNTNVNYNDRLQLWEFELPEGDHVQTWPPQSLYLAVPLQLTYYGWIVQNEASYICTGSGNVPVWSRQFTSVQWPTGYTESNLPGGWNNTNFNTQPCSV